MGSAYYGGDAPKRKGIPMSPMQSERKKATTVPVYSFTWFDVAIVFVSIGTYLADIITDILVTLVYWKLDEKIWAFLTLLFLVVPSIIMQVFSTRWYLADGHKATPSLFLTHALMMGPIKRYIEVLNHGIRAKRTKRIEDYQAMYSELSDVSMLRLFESFLESAPQLVLQLYIMIKVTEDDHILTGIAAFFSLVSLAWAIAAYTKALRTAAYSQDSRNKRVSYAGLALQTVWRVGMVAGRIIALVLCATIYPVWVLVGVGAHWFVMTLWLVIQDTDFCATWWEERLFNAVVGVIHIFCFFNMKEGRSRYRMVSFYAVMFVENSVMILLWHPHRMKEIWYNIPAMCVVWGGFFIGITAMILYYRYFHPSSPKKCHCCMSYYHILYKCCPCHDVTLFRGTPYRRKVNVDETSSEFEYGISNSRREQHVICRIDGTDDSDSSNMDEDKFVKLHPQLTSTPGNDLNVKCENLAERSLDILEESVTDEGTLTKDLQKECVTADDLTSNPGDAISSALILKSLPGGQTGPCANRGNSTLVREWVKKTQDLYGPKNETVTNTNNGKAVSDFGTLRHATKDEREFMQMHFGNFEEKPTGRRDILRLKSFSKKDRQQSNTATDQGKPTNNVSVLRNTFREAFGFHTMNADNAGHCDKTRKIIRKQPKRRRRKTNVGWTIIDIDDGFDQCGDCKTSDEIQNLNNVASVNKISGRLDQPPESSRDRVLRSSYRRDRYANVRKIEVRQASRNSNDRLRDMTKGGIEKPYSEIASPHEKVLSDDDRNIVEVVSEVTRSVQDEDGIPYADASGNSDMHDEAHTRRRSAKRGDHMNEPGISPPKSSDNHRCVSDTTTSKGRRISKLCSEYFGPIIQIKGKTVTVKHRDETPLEIPTTESGESCLLSKTGFDRDQMNLDNCVTGDSLHAYAQPNGVLKSGEYGSESESNAKVDKCNSAPLQVFMPSMVRSNIAQILVANGGSERSFEPKQPDSNRRRTGKYTSHKSPGDSNARKKLSFMKSSKSYSLQDPKTELIDGQDSYKARYKAAETDCIKENQSVKSVEGLSCSMERMLEGTQNYKVHLRNSDFVKKQKHSSNKSKRKDGKNTRRERRTLGSIENT